MHTINTSSLSLDFIMREIKVRQKAPQENNNDILQSPKDANKLKIRKGISKKRSFPIIGFKLIVSKHTLGSEVVIRIVRSTLSKLRQTSSSVFPSISRSCPFGSMN
jgi:hypothetical protein